MTIFLRRAAIGCLTLAVARPATVLAQSQCNYELPDTPLSEMGSRTYKAQPGGLYGDGSNQPPADHEDAAIRAAISVKTTPGPIAMLIVGWTDTKWQADKLLAKFTQIPGRNPNLVVVNAAQPFRTLGAWADPASEAWDQADTLLGERKLTPSHVKVVWMKHILSQPDRYGGFSEYTQVFQAALGDALRAAKIRFPELKLAFLSSPTRTCTDTGVLPEPYAYEAAFAVRGLIMRQAGGDPTLNHDPTRGNVLAPVVLWGPYVWAQASPRMSDGFYWSCMDTWSDCIHGVGGSDRIVSFSLDFFSRHPASALWFMHDTRLPDAGVETIQRPDGGSSVTARDGSVGGPFDADADATITAPVVIDDAQNVPPPATDHARAGCNFVAQHVAEMPGGSTLILFAALAWLLPRRRR